MKNCCTRILSTAIALLVIPAAAMAIPFEASPMRDGTDSVWNFSGRTEARVVMERAGYHDRNTFGIYNGDTFIELLSGGAGEGNSFIFDFADLARRLGSGEFRFYIDSPEGRFFSDTAHNRDLADHMWAVRENDDLILLGFEDLLGGGDNDFDDLVIAFQRLPAEDQVAPVPEPATLLLLGSGLAGLAVWRRRG